MPKGASQGGGGHARVVGSWGQGVALVSLCLGQVAFAGRSNAGKSTLLNELCGRSGTAAVSRRPGSTQSLFFFKVSLQTPRCLPTSRIIPLLKGCLL